MATEKRRLPKKGAKLGEGAGDLACQSEEGNRSWSRAVVGCVESRSKRKSDREKKMTTSIY